MAQFTLYRNTGDNRNEFPYLVDIQNDLLSELATRLVIPLLRKSSSSLRPLTRLTPEVSIEEEPYLLLTPQLAGVSSRELGEQAGSLQDHRDEILAAIDLLVVGF